MTVYTSSGFYRVMVSKVVYGPTNSVDPDQTSAEGWLVGCLILNVPVNNFSVILGRSHRFLGITSTFGE